MAADTNLAGAPRRDLVWDAIRSVAKRLDTRAQASDLTVQAVRRRSLLEWSVTEGLWFGDKWIDGFEPVRTRPLLRRGWREIQPIQEAASRVGRFLRDRPDRGAREGRRTDGDE